MIDLAKVPSELLAPILAGNLRQVGPSRKLIAHFLEAVELRLAADACWLTRAGQGERLLPGGRLLSGDPGLCDEPLATAFLRREHPHIPGTVVLSALVVHGRPIAVVGAARRQGDFGAAARRALERLGGVLAEELARREDERTTRVLDRIREKIASELRPRDLAYQILDGLHQLLEYDHSSAFLAYDREGGTFRIEAEKIVWTKAKSPFVGREVRVPAERIARICRAIEIHTVAEGTAGAGLADSPDPPGIGDGFADLLNYHREAGIPPVTSLLSAPLFYGDEFLGILKVAAWQRPPFARRDLEVVERFLPAAAVSMRNAQVNKSLEMQAVEAEVKASLVTLSHAVAHDVNNAVGSILPLAQQMRFDLRHAPLELETLDRDLGVIIDNARLCQRIFSNMLRVAGSGRTSELPVDVAQVVAETMPFLLALAGRRGIEIVLDLAPDLPSASFRRQDLQHIVLNLVRNSLEALAPGAQGGERGGRVAIAARRGEEDSVELSVADDGPGIPAELLSKVQEPFFSTRPGGTGLGLALCRALAWQNGGSLVIESPIAAPAEMTMDAAGVPDPDGTGGLFDEPEGEVETSPGATAAATMTTAAAASASAGWVAAAGHGGTRVTLRLEAEARQRESW
jgi:signal transduction histidine kinase